MSLLWWRKVLFYACSGGASCELSTPQLYLAIMLLPASQCAAMGPRQLRVLSAPPLLQTFPTRCHGTVAQASSGEDRLVHVWDLDSKRDTEGGPDTKRARVALPKELLLTHAGHRAPVRKCLSSVMPLPLDFAGDPPLAVSWVCIQPALHAFREGAAWSARLPLCWSPASMP